MRGFGDSGVTPHFKGIKMAALLRIDCREARVKTEIHWVLWQ